MPLNALENVEVDYRLPVAEIGPLLGRLSCENTAAPPAVAERDLQRMRAEVKIAEDSDALDYNVRCLGEPSSFTCPECRGVLTVLRDGTLKRYRCHTGHAYSADALLESASEQVEDRLWEAVRALDETLLLFKSARSQSARRR